MGDNKMILSDDELLSFHLKEIEKDFKPYYKQEYLDTQKRLYSLIRSIQVNIHSLNPEQESFLKDLKIQQLLQESFKTKDITILKEKVST